MSSEHAISFKEAADFVLHFSITDDNPKLEVYIGHVQTMVHIGCAFLLGS